jgi:hypothetical protein
MAIYTLRTIDTDLRTNDGDTSFAAFAQGVPRDFTLLSDDINLIPAFDTIDKIIVRWVAKDPTASGDTIKAGIFSGGLRQYGPEQTLDFAGYSSEMLDSFFVDASDGLAWTKAKLLLASLTGLATMVLGSPDPRMTLLIADAYTTPPPDSNRASGSGESLSPKVGTLSNPNVTAASPASLAPAGSGSSLSPSGSAASLSPSVSGAASLSPAGSAQSISPKATPATLHGLSAQPVPLAPKAGAVQSLSPEPGHVTPLAPSGSLE